MMNSVKSQLSKKEKWAKTRKKGQSCPDSIVGQKSGRQTCKTVNEGLVWSFFQRYVASIASCNK